MEKRFDGAIVETINVSKMALLYEWRLGGK
jgi:hypothetical protein